jgi:hypothetical protein
MLSIDEVKIIIAEHGFELSELGHIVRIVDGKPVPFVTLPELDQMLQSAYHLGKDEVSKANSEEVECFSNFIVSPG